MSLSLTEGFSLIDYFIRVIAGFYKSIVAKYQSL